MKRDRTRRATLSLLSTGAITSLSGCISNFQSPQRDQSSPNGDLLSGLSWQIELLQSFSKTHPGRIRISLQNTHEQPIEMVTGRGIQGPFSTVWGTRENGEEELVILADPPGDEHETPPGAPCKEDGLVIPDSPTDGCWEPACEFSDFHAHTTVVIPSNEKLEWEYVVLDGFNETCLPDGAYVFEESPSVRLIEASEVENPPSPGGWHGRLTKRVQLTISGDVLTASGEMQFAPESTEGNAENTPRETPVEGTSNSDN